MRIRKYLGVLIPAAVAIFLGARAVNICMTHGNKQRSDTALKPVPANGSGSIGAKGPITPPINITKISSLLQDSSASEAMRIRQIQSRTKKEEKDVHSVDSINAENIIRNADGKLCSEIYLNGQPLGYLRPGFPYRHIDEVAQGKPGPYTLYDIFPHPIENLYFDITDSKTGMVLGKTVSYYAPKGEGMIDRLVWNDGKEEVFITRDNFMYHADNAGEIVDQNPVWRMEVSSQKDLRLEEWILISDESIRISIGSHMDAYRVLARLQSGCGEDAEMLPEYIEVTPENFTQFIRGSFLEGGKEP